MSSLVPGHTLVGEGAPHAWNGRRWERVYGSSSHGTYWTTGGEGKGLCSCGETSKKVRTAAARKLWHKEHKRKIVEQQQAGGWTPERVQQAISLLHPFVEVKTALDREGNTQVTMSFDDLCSFIEWTCGSMSEHDLDGYVKEKLGQMLQLRPVHEEADDQPQTQ